MTPVYRQETILAMELNRSHIGRLVQIITEGWSMTGTLTRVDQHDNREWSIDYGNGGLIPSGGEIYATVRIGPFWGDIIGNQPVTVETVAGTLEAPERIIQGHQAADKGYYPEGMGEDPPDVIPGQLAELPSTRRDVHRIMPGDARFTLCGLRTDPDGRWIPEALALTEAPADVTCRECIRRDGMWDALPPAPPEWPDIEPPC